MTDRNLILRLFRHLDQLAAVRKDPTLSAAAVEEGLRYLSSVKGKFPDRKVGRRVRRRHHFDGIARADLLGQLRTR